MATRQACVLLHVWRKIEQHSGRLFTLDWTGDVQEVPVVGLLFVRCVHTDRRQSLHLGEGIKREILFLSVLPTI